MSALSRSIFGTEGQFRQTPTGTEQQQGGMEQLLSRLFQSGGLQGQGLDVISQMLGGNQQFLEQLQAPALRQFQEQTIPGLAEMFSGAGAGAQSSSAFQQALGGAGAGLAETLAGQRAQLGMQGQQTGLQALMNLLQQGQAPQFQTAFQPGAEGGLSNLLGGIGQGVGLGFGGVAGKGLGTFFGLGGK